ncbi:Na(+)/H(+) exchange regulatory cofactor NHE-RF1 [Leptopilina heterotoma]|uniref:Na(+)/H(+) exchange regulatory cofactor NHE-RF1 n=1 Tax=Leptopilina heterotoma TaxID=63436 RepID=UPI001CAA32DE|nr:Na(+)/H(+) exchange regulatory cofactor NHE-RF1 [Leptopilina heterotoma]
MSLLKGDQKVPSARLCHIVKWDDFDGYGFNLHAEKGKTGQFIGKVDDGSPSEAAGLRQGDRIIEVNEINIANETHKQVVDRIKAFPSETKLLVVDQEADDYFRGNNIIIKGTMANVKVIKTPERNPATVDDDARCDGSNGSIDENMQKSIDSNDTSHSGLSTAPTATLTNENSEENHKNGSGNMNNEQSSNGTRNGKMDNEKEELNLNLTVKELRAKLAMKKKYDPKKESLGFKDKFDIVQKL